MLRGGNGGATCNAGRCDTRSTATGTTITGSLTVTVPLGNWCDGRCQSRTIVALATQLLVRRLLPPVALPLPPHLRCVVAPGARRMWALARPSLTHPATVPPGWTRPLAEALTRGSCQQSWHSHAFLHLEPRQTLTPPLTPPRRRALRLASTETRADPLRTCIVGQAVTHSSAASWRSSLPLLPLPRCRRGTCVPGGSSGAMSNTAQHKCDARRSRGLVPVSVSQCAA